MAKKQTPKKQPNKVRKAVSGFWQKNWFALLLVVVLLGVLAFIGVNKLIIYNQKKQFDQAEKSLDTLYADIVKNIGQPTSVNKDNHCSYQSTAWGNGDRGCSVNITMFYASMNNFAEAESMANMIDSVLVKNNGLFITDPSGINLQFTNDGSYYSRKSQPISQKHPLDCTVRYYYADDLSKTLLNNSYFRVPDNTNFITYASCHGRAKAEFYPVKD